MAGGRKLPMKKIKFNQAILMFLSAILIIPISILGSSPVSVGAAPQALCSGPFLPVSTSLDDLAGKEYLRMDGTHTGEYGGLYPQGSNLRPLEHEIAGRRIASQVIPLDEDGRPDLQDGFIGMISVGMSNASHEFITFTQFFQADPEVNPQLVLVNGAQSGETSEDWVDPAAPTWDELHLRLQQAGLTPEQVQVTWLKQTQTGYGPFPEKSRSLQAELKAIVHNLKTHFPNLRLVYLSSRTRSYTYWSGLSPEPSAFETGFAVKWLIEDQIEGDPELNYDPSKGPVMAPYLSWGPYLWADGLNPRSDGLVWRPEDMLEDCVHPSPEGRVVIAGLLMDFFKTDSTTGWFTGTSIAPLVPVFLPWMERWE
jgi:hypothetical protein